MRYLVFLFFIIFSNLFSFGTPKIEFNPKQYIVYKTAERIILDGKLDEQDWKKAEWTDKFIDIEGKSKPLPYYETKVKMLWDDKYFYFAAFLEEDHIWAKLKKRDSVIFFDNDFEIFIDPDGDTHNYYEFEMNAYETIWDLLLLHPYREDDQVAIDSWDIQGVIAKVYIDGTLNNPKDIDNFWSVEVAIPWKVLEECSDLPSPPNGGDQWRVNFSRVEWDTKIQNDDYIKLKKPEHNWVWSPQGIINMHYPEMWGFVQFSEKVVGTQKDKFIYNEEENVKWQLRQIYYSQRTYKEKYGKYADNLSDLNITLSNLNNWQSPQLKTTFTKFEAIIPNISGTKIFHIDNWGHTWMTKR